MIRLLRDITVPIATAIAVLAWLVPTPAQAQDTGTLTGTVTDASADEAIPGANVTIPDLQRGAATNLDGVYRIDGIPTGTYEVVARFVGYRTARETVTIRAGEEAEVAFQLREDLLELDEVVVTGQGTSVEKRKLASNVDVINASEIEDAPVSSVDQLLQGRVPGATVRGQSAQPGQGNLINFRGVKSLFADQTPVIYVDGVRMDNASETSFSVGGETTSALTELLTSDIERIEITKGGAASTLYGSDAANGVIQIFTKRGSSGDPRVTFRTEQGANFPVSRFFLDTGFSFPETNPDSPEYDPDGPDAGKTSFIEDEFLRTGHFQNYYVGVSGGNSNLTYNVSGRVQDVGGIQPDNSSTLYAIRGGVQTDLTSSVGVNFSGAYTRNNFSRVANGTAIEDPLTALEVGDALFFSATGSLDEALERFLLPEITEGVDRYTFSVKGNYRPVEFFTSSVTVGIDSRVNEQRILYPPAADPLTGFNSGALTRFNRDFQSLTLEYRGTIEYPREGRITSSFTFGAQGFRDEESIVFADAQTLTPGAEDVGTGGDITADEIREEVFNGGIFFKEQLGLDDRLFLNAGFRLDGNSAFGDDVGLQAYPSVGLAYNVSDESFWSGTVADLVSDLKLRAAYGTTGKFPGAFDRDFAFSAVSYRGTPAPRFDIPGNENLKPEVTSTLEAGVEASLLNDRMAVNFTFYDATTNDALVFVPEQPSTGQFEQLRNIGEIQNRGIELSSDVRILRRGPVFWSLGASWSWNENEVKDLGGLLPFTLTDVEGMAQQRVEEGRSLGAWRAVTPVDTNGDGLLDGTEDQFTGSTPYPSHTGSFNTSITIFDDINVFALADWQLGAEVFDLSSHWAGFNGLERVPRPTKYSLDGEELGDFRTTEAGSELLLDADYFKIREVTIAYNVPSSILNRLGAQSGSVTATMRNIWEFTRQEFIDPELAGVTDGLAGVRNARLQLGGVQSATLSAPRQFRLGLELTF